MNACKLIDSGVWGSGEGGPWILFDLFYFLVACFSYQKWNESC